MRNMLQEMRKLDTDGLSAWKGKAKVALQKFGKIVKITAITLFLLGVVLSSFVLIVGVSVMKE